MTNNFDEFDNGDNEHENHEAVVQTPTAKSNLANAWKSSPLFKLLILMVAVIAIVAASITLFSGHSSVENSHMVNPPNLNVSPGGPLSPYMKQQTDLANQERARAALEKGGSAMDTPVGQSSEIGDLSETKAKNDSLNELRAQVELLQKEQTQQQQVQQKMVQQQAQAVPQQQKAPEQFDESLATAMQHQMSQLMDSWAPRGVTEVVVTKPDLNKADGVNGTAGTAAASTAAAASANTKAKLVVPAGTVNYAQLLTEANSDVPGPILAQIVSGPLSGARAVGQFLVANGYNDYLVLQFNLADRKGREYAINAIALDPDTTLGGMATEVDQRYFTRVILPAAAGFLEGLGSALGQNNSTTTTSGNFAIVQQSKSGVEQGVFQGLGVASQTAAQFFQNQANLTKPLVRVAAGTPMGLFFVTSVYETSEGSISTNLPNGIGGYPGVAGGGSTTIPPYGSTYGANPYSPYGANPYGGAGVPGYGNTGYGTQNQVAGTGYGVPYPNYASPSSMGTGSTVNYVPGYGGINSYGH